MDLRHGTPTRLICPAASPDGCLPAPCRRHPVLGTPRLPRPDDAPQGARIGHHRRPILAAAHTILVAHGRTEHDWLPEPAPSPAPWFPHRDQARGGEGLLRRAQREEGRRPGRDQEGVLRVSKHGTIHESCSERSAPLWSAPLERRRAEAGVRDRLPGAQDERL